MECAASCAMPQPQHLRVEHPQLCRRTLLHTLQPPHARRSLTKVHLRLGNLRFDSVSSMDFSSQRNSRKESVQSQQQQTEEAEAQSKPVSSDGSKLTSTVDEEDDNFSHLLSFLLLGMWGLVLLTSVNAVVGYISHQAFPASDIGLVAARQQAQRQAVYGTIGAGVQGASSRAAVAASPGVVTPFTLALRALAAVLGVLLTGMWQASLAAKATLARVWYAIIIAFIGSIVHFF